jgi:hypothetical protein
MYKEFKMEAYFMIKVSSKGLPVLPMRISSIFGRKQEFSSSNKVLLSLHRRPAYYAFCSWIALD